MTDLKHVSESSFVTIDVVCGADVYDESGKKIGQIEDVYVDRDHGNELYAMLSVGGLLRRHSVKWSTMDYSTDKHGYVVRMATSHKIPEATFDEKLKHDGGYGTTLESCFDVIQPLSS
jgi:uncharacterized protein YrrD